MRNSTKKMFSRSLSGFLAFVTVFILLASLSLIPVMAAEDDSSSDKVVATVEKWVQKFYIDPNYKPSKGDPDNPDFSTEEKRVAATMEKRYSDKGYEIYVDKRTGEVAVKDTATGDYLFSNPYDISEIMLNKSVDEKTIYNTQKHLLMSQVEIIFSDATVSNASDSRYNSFQHSALLGQIQVKRLDGGVRIEYSIGQEETRTLVPRIINLDRFEWICQIFEERLGVTRSDIKNGSENAYSDAAFILKKFVASYTTFELSSLSVTATKDYLEGLIKKYPALENMDIAVYNENATSRDIKEVENWIKSYVPEYTFEDLDKDHKETGYENKDKVPANFRMALEYYITDTGVEVRFPANGLTFDESSYSLTMVEILKYMGAGSNDYNGYTFIPDGSGTLIRFEDTKNQFDITGAVYGEDYAYQEILNPNQEIYRMPVFGVVTSDTVQGDLAPVYGYKTTYEYKLGNDKQPTDTIDTFEFPKKDKEIIDEDFEIDVNIYDALGKLSEVKTVKIARENATKSITIKYPIYEYQRDKTTGKLLLDAEGNYIPEYESDGITHKIRDYYDYKIEDGAKKLINIVPIYKAEKTSSTGYFAIITEGDALTSIVSTHGGNRGHFYNSVYCSFEPRPQDRYNLQEAISVGTNTTYTVVSERKYTGSFRIQYIMLTDPEKIETLKAAGSTRTFYETSYVGMANAYRDYLLANKSIDKLTETEVKADIPLYIESFGKTEDQDTFLSIPITVDVALTTFDDMKQMVSTLKAGNISNINFRLTGFTNGGMVPTVPTKVDFEKVVGNDSGFNKFLDYAVQEGVGVYPEFDFAYMIDTAWFDGFDYDDHAVKSIDDRYITKREYDAVLQTFATTGKICISPSVYSEFFEKFHDSFKDVVEDKKSGISLSTLGSDLNSDFDEDEPYNREDSKQFTVDMLKEFVSKSDTYSGIMVDGGNAYTIPYASVVLNAPIDSSRFLNTSESVPFFGIVYHSYLVYAGKPTNMAGDMQYEKLKIIENGATLYMMLSYQNVEILKEDPYLSKYYAISFEHWKKTLLNQYDEKDPTKLVSQGIYEELNNALKDVQRSQISYHAYINCMRRFSDAELANIEKLGTEKWTAENNKLQAAKNKAVAKKQLYLDVCAQYDSQIRDIGLAPIIASFADTELEAKLVGLNDYDTINMVVTHYEGKKTKLETEDLEMNALLTTIQIIKGQIYMKQEAGEDTTELEQQLDEKEAELDVLKAGNGYKVFEDRIAAIKAKLPECEANRLIEAQKIARLVGFFGSDVRELLNATLSEKNANVERLTAELTDLEKEKAAYEADNLDTTHIQLEIDAKAAELALAEEEASATDTRKNNFESVIVYSSDFVGKSGRIDHMIKHVGTEMYTLLAKTEADAAAAADAYALVKQDVIEALKAEYNDNRIIDDGSVVYVEYKDDNGRIKYFVINYNDYTVDVDTVINGIHIATEVAPVGYKWFYVEPTV